METFLSTCVSKCCGALDLRREACDVAALRRKKGSTLMMMMGEEVPLFYIYILPIVRFSGCYVICCGPPIIGE